MDGLNSIWSRKAKLDGPDEKGAKRVRGKKKGHAVT
jgi:hypothetical protein